MLNQGMLIKKHVVHFIIHSIVHSIVHKLSIPPYSVFLVHLHPHHIPTTSSFILHLSANSISLCLLQIQLNSLD